VQPQELAKTIDHTLLRPDTVATEIERLCCEATTYHFAAVCVLPYFVPLADAMLRDADVKVCTVISFPYGADTPRTKAVAAEDAVTRGADELDVVIDLPALLSGDFGLVRDDLAGVVRAGRMKAVSTGRGQVIVKAIIETCYLTTKMKRMACRICEQAGVDFVKTSTGCGPGGATVKDVELLRDCLDERIGVKASGGIRSFRDVELMINAGAVRVGTSAGVGIMQDLFGS
jgi:deoxyribose-phosphate aldolase